MPLRNFGLPFPAEAPVPMLRFRGARRPAPDCSALSCWARCYGCGWWV